MPWQRSSLECPESQTQNTLLKREAESLKSITNHLVCVGRNLVFFLALLPAALHAQSASPAAPEDSFLYLKVQIGQKVKPASLKPGDVVEGVLTRGVYWHETKVIPSDSRISLVVDRMEQRRRVPNDHWPWVIKAFAPRHEKYPAFRSAHVMLPDDRMLDLKVSLLSIAQRMVLRGRTKKTGPNSEPTFTVEASSDESALKTKALAEGLTANFQAVVSAADFPADSSNQGSFSSAQTTTVPAGTQAKLILLDDLSASGSQVRDVFHARVVEPVVVSSSVIIPAGSIVEGVVSKTQKPRMLSRSGSLLLSFTSLSSSDRTAKSIDASVAGLNLDRRSHTRIDPEGEIQGERPGAAWMLVNLGVAGGFAKVADDSTQLVVEAIISTATDVSTAGTARIVGACVSGVFMLTRHGRDVVLPKFTEMAITFNRPVAFSPAQPSGDRPGWNNP